LVVGRVGSRNNVDEVQIAQCIVAILGEIHAQRHSAISCEPIDVIWVVDSDAPKEGRGAHWRQLLNTIAPSMCVGDYGSIHKVCMEIVQMIDENSDVCP